MGWEPDSFPHRHHHYTGIRPNSRSDFFGLKQAFHFAAMVLQPWQKVHATEPNNERSATALPCNWLMVEPQPSSWQSSYCYSAHGRTPGTVQHQPVPTKDPWQDQDTKTSSKLSLFPLCSTLPTVKTTVGRRKSMKTWRQGAWPPNSFSKKVERKVRHTNKFGPHQSFTICHVVKSLLHQPM